MSGAPFDLSSNATPFASPEGEGARPLSRLSPPAVLLIAGPTASGKSALALEAALAWGGEIVNADALQLYRDLAVLTARPSPEQVAAAPHHLFGVADGRDAWSVGRWSRAAAAVLAEIAARGRPAVVVGGTGLYFVALTRGLSEAPAVSADLRREVRELYGVEGEGAFRIRLAKVDPAAATRINPGDRQRLTRAWEVWRAGEVALSDLRVTTSPVLAPGRWRGLVVSPPRSALYARGDARLAAMMAAGALDEVAALVARGLSDDRPIMKALGVSPLRACLAGDLTADDALVLARRDTRRYAKRQLTWLRHQASDWPRLEALDLEGQTRQLAALITSWGAGAS